MDPFQIRAFASDNWIIRNNLINAISIVILTTTHAETQQISCIVVQNVHMYLLISALLIILVSIITHLGG